MKNVKGCFVCGEDNRSNPRQSKEKVSEAVRKFKVKHPQALLTVEDISCVVNMVMVDANMKEDEETRWAEEEDDDDSSSDIAFMAFDNDRKLEASLSYNVYIHGSTFKGDK